MVSKFGPQHKGAKGRQYTWKFRFKNQNLRVRQASRTFTANEHSISRFESIFPLAPVNDIKSERVGIRNVAIKIPPEK